MSHNQRNMVISTFLEVYGYILGEDNPVLFIFVHLLTGRICCLPSFELEANQIVRLLCFSFKGKLFKGSNSDIFIYAFLHNVMGLNS